MSCFFCALDGTRLASSDMTITMRDEYPVSPGHTLIIPKRHVVSFFDLTDEEMHAVLREMGNVKHDLDHALRPDGYNIGFNLGRAAWQTVMHAHMHVIPRYEGDVPNPRGGIRHVIPDKGDYTPKAT